MLKIYLDEEYGHRGWLWTFPGSKEELIEDWKNSKAPLNFFDPSIGDYKGTMEKFNDFLFDKPKYKLLMEPYPESADEWNAWHNSDPIKTLWEERDKEFDALYPIQGHIHWVDDTWLKVDGVIYHQECIVYKEDALEALSYK